MFGRAGGQPVVDGINSAGVAEWSTSEPSLGVVGCADSQGGVEFADEDGFAAFDDVADGLGEDVDDVEVRLDLVDPGRSDRGEWDCTSGFSSCEARSRHLHGDIAGHVRVRPGRPWCQRL